MFASILPRVKRLIVALFALLLLFGTPVRPGAADEFHLHADRVGHFHADDGPLAMCRPLSGFWVDDHSVPLPDSGTHVERGIGLVGPITVITNRADYDPANLPLLATLGRTVTTDWSTSLGRSFDPHSLSPEVPPPLTL